MAGVAGNGQRELAEVISGMRASTGSVRVGGGSCAGATRVTRSPQGWRTSRGPARHGARAEPEHRPNAVLKTYRTPPVARAASCPPAHARGALAHLALRREDDGPGSAGAQPLRRQSAEARPRPGVPGRSARAGRRAADARARRRRDRDGARLPARGRREGRRGAARQRGPRRDPRARGPILVVYEGRGRRRARRPERRRSRSSGS